MGLLRGLGVLIISLALFGVLISGNLFLTLGLSTDYEVVKPEMISIFEEIIQEQSSVEQSMEIMQIYCERNNTEFILNDENTGEVFIIPCEVIQNGTEATIEHSVGYLVDKVYYADYQCEFWNCFSKTGTPAFLISEKANGYWFSKYYTFLLFTIILFIGLFLLTETKSGALFIFGGLSITSSLLFIKIDTFAEFIINIALSNTSETIGIETSLLTEILSIFFIKSYSVFIWMLSIGVVFIALGVFFKFFGWGIKINNFFSKFSGKKFSKKEVEEILRKKK